MSVEKRIDPENRMSLEFHAARALGRKGKDGKPEFEGLTPETRRAAIRSPETNFREGDAMRTVLLSMLDRIEGVRSPEQQKLLDGLMGQREHATSVYANLKGAPSAQEMMTATEKFLQGLPADVLQGLVEVCPNSSLLVVLPGKVKAPQLLKVIDKKKTVEGQQDGKIWSNELWDHVEAPSWKIAVTDGAEDVPFDESIYMLNPDTERTNEQMVTERKRRFAEKKLGIMPQYGYVPATANRLAKGQVLDREFYTAFERPAGASFLPYAYWNSGRVSLASDGPNYAGKVLRCRPWVEGEM